MNKLFKAFLIVFVLLPCLLLTVACGGGESGGGFGRGAGGSFSGDSGDNSAGEDSPAWKVAVDQYLNNVSFSFYKQDAPDSVIYKYCEVERIGSNFLVKIKMAKDSDWAAPSFYTFNSQDGWLVSTYNEETLVWGDYFDAYFIDSEQQMVEGSGFDQIFYSGNYSENYSKAHQKTGTSGKVVDGKSTTMFDLTNSFGGGLYGNKLFMWNDIIIGREYYRNTGCVVMEEIRDIATITEFSNSPLN